MNFYQLTERRDKSTEYPQDITHEITWVCDVLLVVGQPLLRKQSQQNMSNTRTTHNSDPRPEPGHWPPHGALQTRANNPQNLHVSQALTPVIPGALEAERGGLAWVTVSKEKWKKRRTEAKPQPYNNSLACVRSKEKENSGDQSSRGWMVASTRPSSSPLHTPCPTGRVWSH